MRIAVLGAGAAGLSAAWRLACHGMPVDVYEAAPHVGGLARSLDLWGRKVDLGSHVFNSDDARVWAAWKAGVGDHWKEVPVQRGILMDHGVLEYPFRPVNVLQHLGVRGTVRAVAEYLRGCLRTAAPANAKELMVRLFGPYLAEELFLGYAEKLTGLPGESIDVRFAESLFFDGQHSLLRYMIHRLWPKQIVAYPRSFRWPLQGTGQIWQGLAAEIESRGGRIHLSTAVTRIQSSNGEVQGLEVQGIAREYDHIISSLPLPIVCRGLSEVPAPVRQAAAELRTRNTIVVYLRLPHVPTFAHTWLHIYSKRFAAGRVTNFSRWMAKQEEIGLLAVEYWCDDGDQLWKSNDATIVRRARDELHHCGLLSDPAIDDSMVLRVRGSHPLYRLGFYQDVNVVRNYIASLRGLHTIGRHGAFELNAVAGSMQMGIAIADDLLASAQVAVT